MSVSVGYTWATTVPEGIYISLDVLLWTRTWILFPSTAEDGSTKGVMNVPAGRRSSFDVSTMKISVLRGMSVSI